MPKKIIAWSEPTVFGQDITDLIENYYNCLPIKLSQNKPEDLTEILDLVKESGGGVILAGGNDICPVTLNQQMERGDNLSKFDILRDQRELKTIDYCFEQDIPIFAICRGFQILLGVKYGLGIMQDISSYIIAHSPSNIDVKINENKGEYLHWVSCLTEELQNEFFEREFVTSYHHQSVYFNKVKYVGRNNIVSYNDLGVEVIGIADLNLEDDAKKKADIIELARGVNNRWIASQFHPECQADYLRNPASKIVVDKFGEMINL